MNKKYIFTNKDYLPAMAKMNSNMAMELELFYRPGYSMACVFASLDLVYLCDSTVLMSTPALCKC